MQLAISLSQSSALSHWPVCQTAIMVGNLLVAASCQMPYDMHGLPCCAACLPQRHCMFVIAGSHLTNEFQQGALSPGL